MLRDVINRGRELADKLTNVVMNYTDVEARVREATNDDAWGPTTQIMQTITNFTSSHEHFHEVMGMIWRRLFHEDHQAGWRRAYKSLLLLNYLVRNGPERVVNNVRDHVYDLRTLESFTFVDEFGRDQGINVRQNVRGLLELVQDDNKLREERQRTRENKNKICGYGIGQPDFSESWRGSVEGAESNVGAKDADNQNQRPKKYCLGNIEDWRCGDEPGSARHVVQQVVEQVREVWQLTTQLTPPPTETASGPSDDEAPSQFSFSSQPSRTDSERPADFNLAKSHVVNSQPPSRGGPAAAEYRNISLSLRPPSKQPSSTKPLDRIGGPSQQKTDVDDLVDIFGALSEPSSNSAHVCKQAEPVQPPNISSVDDLLIHFGEPSPRSVDVDDFADFACSNPPANHHEPAVWDPSSQSAGRISPDLLTAGEEKVMPPTATPQPQPSNMDDSGLYSGLWGDLRKLNIDFSSNGNLISGPSKVGARGPPMKSLLTSPPPPANVTRRQS